MILKGSFGRCRHPHTQALPDKMGGFARHSVTGLEAKPARPIAVNDMESPSHRVLVHLSLDPRASSPNRAQSDLVANDP